MVMVCSAIISKRYCLSQCVIKNFRIYLQRWNSIAKNQSEIGFSIMFWNGELILWMKWWIRAVLRSTVGIFVSRTIQRKIHCNTRLRKKKKFAWWNIYMWQGLSFVGTSREFSLKRPTFRGNLEKLSQMVPLHGFRFGLQQFHPFGQGAK